MTPRQVQVACLQLSPVFKDVRASQRRADAYVDQLRAGSLDMLVLPELAFTGYCFDSRQEIEPWLEDPDSGETFKWASKTAMRLLCYVFVGFPERARNGKAFNSMLIVGPDGQLVSVYRKHFLYTTDESWAEEGPGFATVELNLPARPQATSRQVKVCPAICMDLNPHQFTAPFCAFELARHAVEQQVDLINA
ncbi:hypothetical protein OIV83_005226 [Microbotryomycetes sp. JL201]|nr:hypothetical protein OIV83_005226 [Microbotryomycetes sp. JL201]